MRNPGRFEVVGRDPLVILDGAHNPSGAAAAAATLDEGFHVEGGARRLVVGVLAGRDPRELLDLLGAGEAAEVVCCTPDSPRALPAAELAEVVPSARQRRRGWSRTWARPCAPCVGDAEPDDVVLVTGSLYTVGAARTACRSIPGLTVT